MGRERKGSEVDATLNLVHFTTTFRSTRTTSTRLLDPIQTDSASSSFLPRRRRYVRLVQLSRPFRNLANSQSLLPGLLSYPRWESVQRTTNLELLHLLDSLVNLRLLLQERTIQTLPFLLEVLVSIPAKANRRLIGCICVSLSSKLHWSRETSKLSSLYLNVATISLHLPEN